MKFILKVSALVIIAFYVQNAKSQKFSIAGYVENKNTGERIIGAYVVDSLSKQVVIANDFGYFRLVVNQKACLSAKYVGFTSEGITLSLANDTFLVLKIAPIAELEEVLVNANKYKGQASMPLGLSIISVKSLESIPALGEPDLLKSIQSQPGIKGGIEGSSGIYVRGGGGGENLFLLDDVPVYNVSHLYGFFSTFNSSAIKQMKLVKGCFPARYGGRTSSIIDIRSRDGNNQTYSGELSVGLISSRMTLEGPIINHKTTFTLSARRSYLDFITNPFKELKILNNSFPEYYFYDINARLVHTISIKDRLYLSFYNGKDHIQNMKENFEMISSSEKFNEIRSESSGWGNIISSFRWNHSFGKSLFANTTLAYSRYKYFVVNEYKSQHQNNLTNKSVIKQYFGSYDSDIEDFIAKIDFDYTMGHNTMKFGFGNTYHRFNPGINKYSVNDEVINENSDTTFTNIKLGMHEPFMYMEYDFIAFDQLTMNAGLRLSGNTTESNFKVNLEPRFSAVYLLLESFSLKVGYSRMYQYIHLLNSYAVSMPTDLWVPALQNVKPQMSDQINAGISYNTEKGFLFSMEFYYKWLFNTTDYKSGAALITDLSPWYNKIIQGTGLSKGIELSVMKQYGRFKGGVNYTISVADRKYVSVSNESFPFKYDRLHDLSISLNFQIKKNLDISVLWVYGTGYPVTLPIEKYLPALGLYNLTSDYGGEIDYYPNRNNFKLPDYHRLDFSLHYSVIARKNIHKLSFDVFNAYNRNNPVHMYFSGYRNITIQYASLLPIIPSLTYTYKFGN